MANGCASTAHAGRLLRPGQFSWLLLSDFLRELQSAKVQGAGAISLFLTVDLDVCSGEAVLKSAKHFLSVLSPLQQSLQETRI